MPRTSPPNRFLCPPRTGKTSSIGHIPADQQTPSNRCKTSAEAPVLKIGALFLLSLEIILFGIGIGIDPFEIKNFNQDTSSNSPTHFLNFLENYTVHQVHYPTLPGAINAVRNGEAWSAIAFKQNFSTEAFQTVQSQSDPQPKQRKVS